MTSRLNGSTSTLDKIKTYLISMKIHLTQKKLCFSGVDGDLFNLDEIILSRVDGDPFQPRKNCFSGVVEID